MRILIWLLLIFALATGFTLAGKFDPGYAIFVYPPYRMELSLTLFVILLFGALFVLQWFLRIAVATFGLPAQARRFRQRRREQAGERALHAAMLADLDQHPAEAETQARQAFELEYQPALAARLAARAALAQGSADRHDHWMQLAAAPHGQSPATASVPADFHPIGTPHQPPPPAA